MNVSTAKGVSMLALGLGSFAAGVLPALISERARERHPLLISCLLCFGGGVLLDTALVHILPESRAQVQEYAELYLCVGFFIVYLVDEIVHLFYNPSERSVSQRNYGSGEGTSLLREDAELKERCHGETENPRMCHVSHTEPCNRSSSGIIGLLCALFVHSVLEGFAIGLQDTTSQVLILLAAVACHKFVVGFCLGAELCASFEGRVSVQIICITLFSLGSVVGIALGAVLDVVSALKDSTAVPIMQLLAAGTLLYVTVSEVLPRERARWHERKRTAGIAQFISVGVGFGIMYLATKYLDHDGA